MNIKIDINVCRVCLKSGDGKSLFSEQDLGEKFKYVTQAKVKNAIELSRKCFEFIHSFHEIYVVIITPRSYYKSFFIFCINFTFFFSFKLI